MTELQNKRTIMLLARGHGKSVWNQIVQSLIQPDIQTLSSVIVDEKIWYTVKLTMPAAEWLRHQPQSDWYEHNASGRIDSNCFDVSAELYTALKLKWS